MSGPQLPGPEDASGNLPATGLAGRIAASLIDSKLTPLLMLGALLLVLPAYSLPSAVMVGRALGWRVTAATGALTAGIGVLAGGLLTVLL